MNHEITSLQNDPEKKTDVANVHLANVEQCFKKKEKKRKVLHRPKLLYVIL